MPKLPVLKPVEVEKILIKSGFVIVHTKGSHKTYHNKDTHKTTTIAFHNKDIPSGTLRAIIRQSGLPVEDFLRKKN